MKYLLILLSALTTVHAQHTFSIVAIDPLTGEVGSAGATCLVGEPDYQGARIISQLAPGFGAINAQASVCEPNLNGLRGRDLLSTGIGAQQVLDSLLTRDVCGPLYSKKFRQYGIVSIDASKNVHSAAYSGDSCLPFAGHIAGATYSIQGNILLGKKVIDSIEAHYLRATGTLAERLMYALQGAKMVGADSRCKDNGTSSRSAFIRVARPADDADAPTLDLAVYLLDDGVEPIDTLQRLFNSVTSVDDRSLNPKILLRPNPVMNELSIHFIFPTVASSLSIYDNLGNVCLSIPASMTTDQRIDVSALRDGVYLLVVQEGDVIRNTAHFCVCR